jgi:DHA1 family bicyclomycin/chloramphenicol resistance-like MFS transporter
MVIRRTSLAVLFAMMFASQLALTIFLPAAPDISQDLGTPLNTVQLIIPAYLIAFAIMQLVAGPLSDAFGRRPVILGGVALFMLASIACALAGDITQLLIGRFFQAAGACTSIVVGRAIIRDTNDGKSAAKAMSYLAISLGVGPAIAPFFGGLLVEAFDWRATFIATAVMSGLSLVFAIPVLRETLPPEDRDPPNIARLAVGYARLVRMPTFMGYSLAVSMQSGIFQVFMTASPIVLISVMGLPPRIYGMYLMIVPVAFMLGSFASGQLVSRMESNTLVRIGGLFSVTGGLMQVAFAVTGIANPALVVAAVLVSNFGTGLVFATCYSQALNQVPPSFAGSASALGGFLHMGWGFLLALTVANLPHPDSLNMGLVQSATTIASVLLFLTLVVWRGRRVRP